MLGHIGILVETYVDLRIFFMKFWTEWFVIHTLQVLWYKTFD
jgi:hypothetical protein